MNNGSEPQDWIPVASKEHVDTGVEQGIAQLCHGKLGRQSESMKATKKDRSARLAKLPAAGDPQPSSIQRKIQNADEWACNRQNGCGHVGIY